MRGGVVLRRTATFVVVTALAVVVGLIVSQRGYRLPGIGPIQVFAGAPFGGATSFPPQPPPEMATCSSPLTSADERIAACTRAIASGGLTPDNQAVAFCDRGTGYQLKRQTALALADFDEAVRLEPEAVTVHICRGDAEIMRDAFDKAIEHYDQEIAHDANSHGAYVGRGVAYSHQHDLERSIADDTKAIALDGSDPVAFSNRGGSYQQQKRYELAIADYSQAIKLDPQNTAALTGRGAARAATKDYDSAIVDLDVSLRFNPQAADAYTMRGYCHFQKGHYGLALADGLEALRLDPKAHVTYLDASRARLKPRR